MFGDMSSYVLLVCGHMQRRRQEPLHTHMNLGRSRFLKKSFILIYLSRVGRETLGSMEGERDADFSYRRMQKTREILQPRDFEI